MIPTPPPSEGASSYLNFEEFPVTTSLVPGNSLNWEYSSLTTNNSGFSESQAAGWKSRAKLTDGWNWFWIKNWRGSCDSHMGIQTHGYLKIASHGHFGNALSHTVTGGLLPGDCVNVKGTPLYALEQYTGMGDVYTGGKIGHSYLYFNKVEVMGSLRNTTPYASIRDKNRMSAYIYLPPETSNGLGGYGSGVNQTYQVGLFRDPTSTGYHHYVNFYTRGGGWTKIQIEETTNGDNGGNGATRHIPDFLKSVWQFYFTTQPYAGIAIPPYDILFDDIEFSTDSYAPQNNETISNLAVMFRGSDKSWEISFNDKYKNNANAHATFEVRYSLSGPITNENWAAARPVEVQADPRFYIQARTDGKFQKWWPYYQGVWAPFRLNATDTAALVPGKTVFFAVKDISQNPTNGMLPMDGINGYSGAGKGGRPYSAYPAVFNYAADSLAMPHVKRIHYVVGATP